MTLLRVCCYALVISVAALLGSHAASYYVLEEKPECQTFIIQPKTNWKDRLICVPIEDGYYVCADPHIVPNQEI